MPDSGCDLQVQCFCLHLLCEAADQTVIMFGQGMLPSVFAKLSSWDTPWVSILVSFLGTIALLFCSFDTILQVHCKKGVMGVLLRGSVSPTLTMVGRGRLGMG